MKAFVVGAAIVVTLANVAQAESMKTRDSYAQMRHQPRVHVQRPAKPASSMVVDARWPYSLNAAGAEGGGGDAGGASSD